MEPLSEKGMIAIDLTSMVARGFFRQPGPRASFEVMSVFRRSMHADLDDNRPLERCLLLNRMTTAIARQDALPSSIAVGVTRSV